MADIAELLQTERPVDKFVHHDDQWQFEERRAEELGQLRSKLRDRKSAVAVADRLLALEGQAGYREFVTELERRRDARVHELVTTTSSDSYLRVLQGRCQELGALISLMRNLRENREALATEVSRLEDELDAVDRQSPKPRDST